MALMEYKMPDPGEGLVEAEIVTWHIQPGDTVEVNQIVLEIETAKSLVDLPIPWDGVVKEILVGEGETVEVGTPIVLIETDAAAAASAPAGGSDASGSDAGATNEAASAAASNESATNEAAAPSAQAAAADDDIPADLSDASGANGGEQQEKTLVGYGPQATSTKRRARKGRVQAAPATRGYAKNAGVDIEQVSPGTDGIVRPAQVDEFRGRHASGQTAPAQPAAAAAPSASSAPMPTPVAPVTAAVPPQPAGLVDERIPIKGVRKVTAQTMVASAFSAPHVTEFLEVDMTETMNFVAQLQKDREFRDIKVTPLLIVAKACLIALKREPMMNALWDDAAQEIEMRSQVNLGIAAATSRGLLVPNIKDAGRFGLAELGREIGKIVEIARNGKPSPAILNGGTFSISNIGVFGVDSGTPIIKPGESGILAVGTVRSKPWVVTNANGEEEIAIRKVAQLSLSFDHRLIDGDVGSRFIATVGSILENPARAMIWS